MSAEALSLANKVAPFVLSLTHLRPVFALFDPN